MNRSLRKIVFMAGAAFLSAAAPVAAAPSDMGNTIIQPVPPKHNLESLSIGPAAGGAPQQIIVMLHGIKNNKFGLLALAQRFSQALPHAVIVLPEAPFAADEGDDPAQRQWFSMKDWYRKGDPDTTPLVPGLKTAAAALNSFIDGKLAETGLDNSKLIVAGFSQGAMTALYTGLHRPSKIAGIIAWSERFIEPACPDIAQMQKPPVLLMHGDRDGVIPLASFMRARDILSRAGFPLTAVISPDTGHEVKEDEIRAGIAFARDIFNLPAPAVQMTAPAPS